MPLLSTPASGNAGDEMRPTVVVGGGRSYRRFQGVARTLGCWWLAAGALVWGWRQLLTPNDEEGEQFDIAAALHVDFFSRISTGRGNNK